MFKTNLFNKFFNIKKSSSHAINRYIPNENFQIEEELKKRIQLIDKEIKYNSQNLINAQAVKLKSTFSTNKNILQQLQQNLYQVPLDESIVWYRKKLGSLYKERQSLQFQYEKMSGKLWPNRIKRLFIIGSICLVLCFAIFILFSGIIAVLYLLPLWGLIFFSYLAIKKAQK